uniref:Polyhomeotic homolog 2a (Drosophila) n=1 Tax=Lepisosteus oculatus TaxID=7918 RepID=W5M7Q1_LEPOC
MESDQVPSTSSSAVSTTASTSTISTSSSSSNGRQTVPQISVYSGIPDRQTVQVIQQALHRQPNTAAQYLQQMYAAQQQHLMLQTAALQQQHLNNAQLQSLAAVQQASMAAGRQGTNQNGTTSQQTGSSQTTINLATSPAAAAQLISRAQSVNSAPAGITQQAVLLGNTSGPGLTASQAQMYLRAQMVQNLAIRSQQGAASGSPSQTQLQSLSLKQVASGPQPVPSGPATAHTKGPGQGAQSGGAKGGSPENTTEGGKKGESSPSLEARVMNVSRNVTSVSSHPLITPAYTQIQPHQLIQHQQHKQHQFVIQQQSQLPQRSQAQLLHTASIQPQLQTQAQPVQALTIQSALATQSQSQQCSIPVLPKPPAHQAPAPSQQATIFHSTVSPQNGHPTAMNQAAHPKPQPVQLAAVNLQIQPAPNTATIPQQPAPAATLTIATTEQRKTDTNKPMAPGSTAAITSLPSVWPPAGSPTKASLAPLSLPSSGRQIALASCELASGAMTSGNGNNAPTVTGSTPQNGENKPPQAIVKPQILTHVIEGFVIQEGAEPFPVGRPPLLIENLKKQKQQLQSDPEKTPQSNPPNTTDSEMEDLTQQELKDQEEDAEPKLKCELCGRVDFAYKFKRSKRFCSMACAKRYNVGCTKRVGLFHPDRSKNAKSDGPKHRRRRSRKGSLQNLNKETKKQQAPTPLQSLGGSVSSPPPSHPSQGESSQCSDISSYEEPPSPLSAASSGAPRRPGDRGPEAPEGHTRELPLLTQHFLPSDPTKWNVEDVYEFIRSLPGCQEIADEFRSQEIDGQAMLLLKEDHLMSAMNIKLGPALKIYARINMLKDS